VFDRCKPVVYGENSFDRILFLKQLRTDQYEKVAKLLQNLLKLPQRLRPKNRIQISQINNQPAARTQFATFFLKNGYEKDDDTLVLWPSSV
jgi:hypothetical protein